MGELPEKLPLPEEEEESEEEEEIKPEPKKKLSKADLKPSVQIKVDAAPEEKPKRRKKKEEPNEEEQGSLFENVPEVKPKVSEEFTEKDKMPKEEEKTIITPAELPEKLPLPEEEEES